MQRLKEYCLLTQVLQVHSIMVKIHIGFLVGRKHGNVGASVTCVVRTRIN